MWLTYKDFPIEMVQDQEEDNVFEEFKVGWEDDVKVTNNGNGIVSNESHWAYQKWKPHFGILFELVRYALFKVVENPLFQFRIIC